jgi:hypothetical protein
VTKSGSRRSAVTLVLAAVVALAAGPAAAPAQTEEYYREIAVDGRIYVFSTEKKFTAYEQSKDMGVSITRLGYGPNGETVIFEDAKAVELFNRKHGKSEAPPEEAKTPEVNLPFNVQYRMPGLRFSFPKAEVNLTNRLQFRYTQEDLDTTAQQADRGSFRIRRARTKLDGWIYTKDITFEVQADWVGLGSWSRISRARSCSTQTSTTTSRKGRGLSGSKSASSRRRSGARS